MTKFERDILACIDEGYCYTDPIAQRLMEKGRTKVDMGRLLAARGRLHAAGIIQISLAARMSRATSVPSVPSVVKPGGAR